MTLAQRNIKLAPKLAPELNRTTGDQGELYYDITSGTLRLYTGRRLGGTLLATQPFVNTSISTALTPYARSTDLAGLATETFVTTAIGNIDYSSYATKTFVTSAIGNIDLSSYATHTEVSTAISNLVNAAPSTLNTLSELATALGNDASFSTTIATSIGLKAPVNNPTFTGTVGGITATMVGLGNVTNESKATMFTSPIFTGTTVVQQTSEMLNTKTGATGTVVHDFSTGAIWYHDTPAADFTVNITNVPTTNNKTSVCTLIVNQGATARGVSAIQIDGVATTIKWAVTPYSGDANKVNLFSFSLVRVNDTWIVLGSIAVYGV